tara:strand:+ start:1157 stop:1642 length:486 start_codon:yes stop_codon:yes gene_type:complete
MNTNIITPEGYTDLEKELDYLWREERPEITKIVKWAASLGDRSENADYQYNKKRLREIDRRVRFLKRRLEQLRIVHYDPVQEGKVFFGAWVTLIDENDDTLTFRVVGPDEIYGKVDYVSINAPVVRACLGRCVGDEIIVRTPEANKEWEIKDIEYLNKSDN